MAQPPDRLYPKPAESRAAKVVSTGELGHDTRPMPAWRADPILWDIAGPVSGMNYLQISRTRGVAAHSMHFAFRHLANELADPTMVHTANPELFNFFHLDTDSRHLRYKIVTQDDGGKSVLFHPLFEQFRARETCIWPVRVSPSDCSRIDPINANEHWCLVVATFDQRQPCLIPRGQPFRHDDDDGYGDDFKDEYRDRWYDRSLRDLKIIDPLMNSRAEQRNVRQHILKVIEKLFDMAGVAFRQDAWDKLDTPNCDQVEYAWQTGYQVYSIGKEYMRRLNLLHYHRRTGDGRIGSDFWNSLMSLDCVGLMGTDAARESMLAGCAITAITMSRYQARLAVELPGEVTYTDPDALDPSKAQGNSNPRRLDPEEMVGDHMIEAPTDVPNGKAWNEV